MKNSDNISHARGESKFIDDLSLPKDALYAAIYYSPIGHGEILNLDLIDAYSTPGVKAVLTYAHIPGENQIGGVIKDETLLAEDFVHYAGQPIAIVVAESPEEARKAAKKIKAEFQELPVVTDAYEAFMRGDFIIPPRVFSIGDTSLAWERCQFIVEGTAETGAQEHLYLETQSSVACMTDSGSLKVISSTQAPTAVQRAVSRVTGLPMNKIEVEAPRLGGAFGGKEDQANAFAAMAALVALKLNRTVKLVLSREDDIRITGKRHPYSSNFKMGLDQEGKILAYEVTFYQNAGASADLSPAILDRTLFHATNSYFIPNVKATAYCLRTNLPPNTAFRGFGAPQGMFVIESAIYKAAEKMGVDAGILQEKNLLNEGDLFPYAQKAEGCNAKKSWESAMKNFSISQIEEATKKFNRENKFFKKGFALMPICFGISFTNTFMNQAGALVHIYQDGSVGISTGAVEMGQGVNMKLRQIAAKIFSVDIEKIKVESANTTRVANTSPTAASAAADMNGKALEKACRELLERLIKAAALELEPEELSEITIENEEVRLRGDLTGISWKDLVDKAFRQRCDMSSHAHYATPGIYFDRNINQGRPFNYHVYGTAVVEVTLDCLRGTYEVNSVKAVHDFGKSLNPLIDKGQAEGAILQGLGWLTMEEVTYDNKGRLLSNGLSSYKVPDIYFSPKVLKVECLENSSNQRGIFNSKAIGEPPFMYGIGVYFALLKAIKEFRPDAELDFKAPLTHERVLMALYREEKHPVTA
ncbi:MAG: molybdopterin-dependent oxidoreductase [Ignavibacteria bacterium]|jgi:xanthine dehydrogenase large subunit|nr:molybdopterin-dependent oxidoreductase [Ignavibacteria bacterium]MCU7524869.1 molybdopterin-dependent oxidoreductase [Ignavibacteria bacterium]HEX2963301.1 molybdopterin cofactor-binding domain-containing protein [Ignavibacteriales bacterium]